MFFLPLPLDKTLKNIDDIENDTTIGLPDPELYIIVKKEDSVAEPSKRCSSQSYSSEAEDNKLALR